jgi:hypothetical protein
MKFAILLLIPLVVAADKSVELARIEAEPHAEKRARAALDYADETLREAREAYAKSDTAATSERLEELEQSIELVDSSLKATGKNPSRSPKNFKYAELKIRELLRKLDGFREEMSVTDRPVVERVMAEVQKIHDALLDGIMGKRK